MFVYEGHRVKVKVKVKVTGAKSEKFLNTAM